jgi:GNAT superfamily N-acetyltransferase
MPIEIRPADLESDAGRLVNVLAKWLTPRSDEPRFNWLYRDSPHGRARAWLAVRKEDDSIAGAAAAFPRTMYVRGKEVPACVYGDFCVSPEYRSLGLALRLQRACFESTESGWASLAYDFPSSSMMAIYIRLGSEKRGSLTRFAKPLRVDRKVRETIKNEPLAAAASGVLNAVLSWSGRASSQKGRDVSLHQGTCGEEFSLLAEVHSQPYQVCILRTAAYLNWRYLSHPHVRHEILTSRRSGRLEGYIVFCQEGKDARIVDLFGVNDEEMLGALISSSCELLRDRGVITVSAPVVPSHPRAATLKRAGFHPRESTNVVFFLGPQGQSATPVSDWFLMDGDRDS